MSYTWDSKSSVWHGNSVFMPYGWDTNPAEWYHFNIISYGQVTNSSVCDSIRLKTISSGHSTPHWQHIWRSGSQIICSSLTLIIRYQDLNFWRQTSWSTLFQVMAYRLLGANPLHDDMLINCQSQGTYFNEILFEIQKFSFKKMHLKLSSVKLWPFCLSLNIVRIILP